MFFLRGWRGGQTPSATSPKLGRVSSGPLGRSPFNSSPPAPCGRPTGLHTRPRGTHCPL